MSSSNDVAWDVISRDSLVACTLKKNMKVWMKL